jgi:hypothetical protein
MVLFYMLPEKLHDYVQACTCVVYFVTITECGAGSVTLPIHASLSGNINILSLSLNSSRAAEGYVIEDRQPQILEVVIFVKSLLQNLGRAVSKLRGSTEQPYV